MALWHILDPRLSESIFDCKVYRGRAQAVDLVESVLQKNRWKKKLLQKTEHLHYHYHLPLA